MPIHFTCPRCQTHYHDIRREFEGKRIQCQCGEVLRLGPKPAFGSDSDGPVSLPPQAISSPPKPHSQYPNTGEPIRPQDLTQIVNRDELFGTPRKSQSANAETSFINPVSPQEKQRYIVTSMIPNYSTHSQPESYAGVAANQTNVEKYYQQLNQPRNTSGAVLGAILGALGALQGGILSLLSLVSAFRTFQAMGALDGSSGNSVGDSVMIELLLMLLVLCMNLGLGTFGAVLVFGCIEEMSGSTPRSDQISTMGLIGALYLGLLILLVCFLIFVMPQREMDTEIANRLILATQTAVTLSIIAAIIGAVPLALTIYGVLRGK